MCPHFPEKASSKKYSIKGAKKMRFVVVGAATIIAASLSGCGQPHLEGSANHGRYVGVGIYHPETQWTKMIGADATNVTPAARTIDDQAIIVVEDSETGEIRACGDLTGYCIRMNPWKKMLASSNTTPINLTEHVPPPKSEHSTSAK
jgi:hypothetical protein